MGFIDYVVEYFKGPQGDPGPQGESGPQGAQGSPGITNVSVVSNSLTSITPNVVQTLTVEGAGSGVKLVGGGYKFILPGGSGPLPHITIYKALIEGDSYVLQFMSDTDLSVYAEVTQLTLG